MGRELALFWYLRFEEYNCSLKEGPEQTLAVELVLPVLREMDQQPTIPFLLMEKLRHKKAKGLIFRSAPHAHAPSEVRYIIY